MITDVDGVLVGHHHRLEDGWATGTTVVLAPGGAIGGVDCRGGAPGTRETDLLRPENMVSTVHGVCLSGGSAYGLAAADGVMRWLSSHGHGLPVGAAAHELVPIVPAAVIFDLPRSSWGSRPDAEFGSLACDSASSGTVKQGTVGAGTGATVGSLKGGVGTASTTVDGFTVGALAVVNASGEAVDLATGRPWASDGIDVRWPDRSGDVPSGTPSDLNTTIGVVATDAALTKAECRRLAMSAQDGLARAVRPAHTMFDGDTVFSLATGRVDVASAPGPVGARGRAAVVDRLFTAAATVFARSVVHGVLQATSAAGVKAYRDVWPEVL